MGDTCKSCSAPVLWVIMPSGKRNPLDAEPSDKGNVRARALQTRGEMNGHTQGVVLKGPALEEARAAGEQLYVSHFATCPSAAQHRRRP